MPEEKPYTDAYYDKDGYRTKQYAASIELDPRYAQPQAGYKFNEFPFRTRRRQLAKSKGIFKLGIWKDSLKKLVNIQTFVKPKEEDDK